MLKILNFHIILQDEYNWVVYLQRMNCRIAVMTMTMKTMKAQEIPVDIWRSLKWPDWPTGGSSRPDFWRLPTLLQVLQRPLELVLKIRNLKIRREIISTQRKTITHSCKETENHRKGLSSLRSKSYNTHS